MLSFICILMNIGLLYLELNVVIHDKKENCGCWITRGFVHSEWDHIYAGLSGVARILPGGGPLGSLFVGAQLFIRPLGPPPPPRSYAPARSQLPQQRIETEDLMYEKPRFHPVSGHFELIQCVPIKRKPVLSVRYLHCHARLKQTVCFIIKSIFSSFIWYQTHNDISMHEWKGTI